MTHRDTIVFYLYIIIMTNKIIKIWSKYSLDMRIF